MSVEAIEVKEGERAQLHSLLSLRVTAEADPGAIVRVLHPFQNLNINPRRALAQQAITVHFQRLLASHLTGTGDCLVRLSSAIVPKESAYDAKKPWGWHAEGDSDRRRIGRRDRCL